MEERGRGVLKFFLVLLCLNLFFLSINLMGAFKGDAKEYAQHLISSLYHNPMLGLMIGILITGIMQSSSATTAIVVSFVATGLFGTNPEQALYGAIPIIMGANIGTTITSAIVAVGHVSDVQEFKRAFSAALVHDIFNFLTVIILFPIQVLTNFLGKIAIFMADIFSSVGGMTFVSPLTLLIKPQARFVMHLFETYKPLSKVILLLIASFIFIVLLNLLIQEIITLSKRAKYFVLLNSLYLGGVIFVFSEYSEYILTNNLAIFLLALTILFTSLGGFVKIMRGLTSGKLEVLFNKYIFKNASRAFVIGIILTAIIQSSSVTISIMVPLAGAGILNLFQIFPYAVGANIGTTITAMLAALSLGEVTGIAVAFAHLAFNLIGATLIYPIRIVPIKLSQYFANLVLVNKAVPVALILFVYILLPFIGIMLFR